MFEHLFKFQLVAIDADKLEIEKLWNEIKKEYSKKSRHYHNLSHLDNLTMELLAIKDRISDWQTLVFSIAYHDIVYSTLKSDNEEKSAEFARRRLTKLSIADLKKEKCVSQIIATKSHNPSEDNDTNYFTDADLSILGADNEQYFNYSSLIRKEYKFYPDIVYNPGRQKVLRHFLSMERIYKTNYFRDKYEKQAKENINDELRRLS